MKMIPIRSHARAAHKMLATKGKLVRPKRAPRIRCPHCAKRIPTMITREESIAAGYAPETAVACYWCRKDIRPEQWPAILAEAQRREPLLNPPKLATAVVCPVCRELVPGGRAFARHECRPEAIALSVRLMQGPQEQQAAYVTVLVPSKISLGSAKRKPRRNRIEPEGAPPAGHPKDRPPSIRPKQS